MFHENANEGSASIKSCWNTINPFISSRGNLSGNNIIIEALNDTNLTVNGSNSVFIKAKHEICDEILSWNFQ